MEALPTSTEEASLFFLLHQRSYTGNKLGNIPSFNKYLLSAGHLASIWKWKIKHEQWRIYLHGVYILTGVKDNNNHQQMEPLKVGWVQARSSQCGGRELGDWRCVCMCVCVCVLVAQSCPTLCDSMDCSSPGPSVQGILQERILEWLAIPFSRGSSQPRDQTWSPALQADSLPSEHPGKPRRW